MLDSKFDMAYIEQFIQEGHESRSIRCGKTVSLSYAVIWNHICGIGLIKPTGYTAYAKRMRVYHADYNVFHGMYFVILVFKKIKIPKLWNIK